MAIVRGEKRYEFRRTRFAERIDVILVYATVPIGRVIGEFEVKGVIRDAPEALWRLTREFAGLGLESFDEYFEGREVGYAIEIGEVRKYRVPFCPRRRLGVRPPQSFVYLDRDEG